MFGKAIKQCLIFDIICNQNSPLFDHLQDTHLLTVPESLSQVYLGSGKMFVQSQLFILQQQQQQSTTISPLKPQIFFLCFLRRSLSLLSNNNNNNNNNTNDDGNKQGVARKSTNF